MGNFSNTLLRWFDIEKRDLPWKSTNDPYKVWISEIILQQTRVEQGSSYYVKFINRFPTLSSLANADEDDVLKMWEGLGYYSRARNLHYSAKTIMLDYGGVFPSNYDDILALKGIGPYTAAAIMSYAYGKKYAVVDGNVLRIISRYLGIQEPVDKTYAHKTIQEWLAKQISSKRPGDFNQAMMDLGATICTPKNWHCGECPIKQDCYAYKEEMQNFLPVKSKIISKKDRFFHYFVINDTNGNFLLKKRTNDIWQGLYDFPMIEASTSNKLTTKAMTTWAANYGIIDWKPKISQFINMEKHILTHQNIYTFFYTVELVDNTFDLLKEYFIFASKENIANFAFPKIVNLYLKNHTGYKV